MTALKSILATIFVPGIACLLIPYFILRGSGIPLAHALGFWQIIAIPVAIVGVYMVVWVSFSFVRTGRGTPIPIDPPKHLVVHGLYRYVRNPMYAGAMLVLLAEVVYYSSIWVFIYTTFLWMALHTFTVVLEEPQLKRRFGAEYERYLESVPRWVPRVRV
jgi:protein-S-isoprenylcysteine O-methyltransferase Ste14